MSVPAVTGGRLFLHAAFLRGTLPPDGDLSEVWTVSLTMRFFPVFLGLLLLCSGVLLALRYCSTEHRLPPTTAATRVLDLHAAPQEGSLAGTVVPDTELFGVRSLEETLSLEDP